MILDWIKDNLPWLFSGLGLTMITSLVVVVRKMVATFRLRSAVMSKFNGNYECFHVSTSLNRKVVRSSVTISSDLWGRTQVRVESFGYKYEGTAECIENNLYVELKGKDHNEHSQLIFNEPLTSEFDVLIGVYSGVTENRVPVIGKMLWHKTGLTTSCTRIRFENADPRIISFLAEPENPITVQRVDLPVLEEMLSASRETALSRNNISA